MLSPLHHSAPLRFALHTVLAGGRLLVPGPFDAGLVTAVIAAERPTTMFCVPTHLYRLFRHWAEVGVPDLSSFRLVAHAGAPCPEPVKRRLQELFPPGTTWEFYGATEGQFTACRSEDWATRPGTVGRARPGRRLRTDPDGTLWCRVPPYARFGYLGDPARTAAAWRQGPDGPEFTVGDHGRLDADGWLWLHGRGSDLVISGGVKVYPLEVEETLRGCPGVDDIAVYGVPDEEWGQRVCAAVVGTVSTEELGEYARQRLTREATSGVPPPRVPPHTATGKVRRQDLP
ncbi:MAG: fatty acid--CoA ligase family protein [Nocardioides sp.]